MDISSARARGMLYAILEVVGVLIAAALAAYAAIDQPMPVWLVAVSAGWTVVSSQAHRIAGRRVTPDVVPTVEPGPSAVDLALRIGQ
jgi:hypothetical protein